MRILARALTGLGLIAIAWRPPAAVLDPFRWQPFQLGVYALGLVVLAGAVLQHVRPGLLEPRRAAPAGEPATPHTGAAAPAGEPAATQGTSPPDRRAARLRLALEIALPAALAAVSLALHFRWLDIANPHRILSGYDYNVYLLNALAASTGEWSLFNPDKRAFHPRVVAWFAGEGDLRPVLVYVSVVSAAMLAPVTYGVARAVAGPGVALVAALYLLAQPLPWHYASQTTAYAFFYTLVTASAGALVWAIRRPSVLSGLVAGVLIGAAIATQEKTAVVLLPVLGIGGLLALPSLWALRPRWKAPLCVLLLVLSAGFVADKAAAPMRYTPLVSLVSNQREEIHREVPYTWPVVKNPDPTDPAGIRAWLPRAFWDGELESWLASATTPPDSNSLRLVWEGDRATWIVKPDTSLPPVEMRLEKNVRELRRAVGPVPAVDLALLALGALGLLLCRPPVPVALAGVFLSAAAPMTLKFYPHYLPQVLPIYAVMVVAGLDRLLRLLLAGRALYAGRAVALVVLGAHALVLWTGDRDAWRAPEASFPPPATTAKDDPGGYAYNLQQVATWLRAQDHADRILDCVPGSMLMVAHRDPRFPLLAGDSQCAAGLATARPGDWVVASGHMEYRSPRIPKPGALLAAGWAPIYGWGPQGATRDTLGPSNVLVLEKLP